MMFWPRTASLYLVAAVAFGCVRAPTDRAPVAQASWLPPTQQNLLGSWELSRVDTHAMRGDFSLTFRADGTITGKLTCGNTLMGGYRVTQQHFIDIGGYVSERGCDVPPLLAAAEKSLLSPSSAYLSRDRSRLFIVGSRTLQFSRTA